jgi:hypothetical protein
MVEWDQSKRSENRLESWYSRLGSFVEEDQSKHQDMYRGKEKPIPRTFHRVIAAIIEFPSTEATNLNDKGITVGFVRDMIGNCTCRSRKTVRPGHRDQRLYRRQRVHGACISVSWFYARALLGTFRVLPIFFFLTRYSVADRLLHCGVMCFCIPFHLACARLLRVTLHACRDMCAFSSRIKQTAGNWGSNWATGHSMAGTRSLA